MGTSAQVRLILVAAMSSLFMLSCADDDLPNDPTNLANEGRDLTAVAYEPTTHVYELPDHFREMPQPADNMATEAGVKLGQRLFFDPVLSRDSTISCATCHDPALAFTDGVDFSIGINQRRSLRSSMSLVNVGLQNLFFWDGRSGSLEDQSLHPIEDPLEMDAQWPVIEAKLQSHSSYPEDFRRAFGITNSLEVNRALVAKAIAQFERSITSTDSRFDKVFYGREGFLTELEDEGMDLFFKEPTTEHPGCAHCHNAPTFADIDFNGGFRNNGLTATTELDGFPDFGRGGVTGNPYDNGKFRAPTLRNIELTAPYMHDGRFATLDEVLEHYATGGHFSPTRDVQMLGFPLDQRRKDALKAFLFTLTDRESLARAAVNDPN